MFPDKPVHTFNAPPRLLLRDRKIDADNMFCAAPLGKVMPALWKIEASLLERGKTVYDHVQRKQLLPDFRDMYLYPLSGNATLFWIWPSMTEVLARLSQELATPIAYFSFTDHMHMREFYLFEDGAAVVELLDPEKPMRTNRWTGADLGGHGPRRWRSLDAFLTEVKQWYTPVDWTWHYGKWHFDEMRRETLALPECRIRWSVKIDVAQKLVEPVGEVTDADALNVAGLRSDLLSST